MPYPTPKERYNQMKAKNPALELLVGALDLELKPDKFKQVKVSTKEWESVITFDPADKRIIEATGKLDDERVTSKTITQIYSLRKGKWKFEGLGYC